MNIEEKIKLIVQGNPGALTVVSRLQWYTLWHEMLDYIIQNKWIGGELWSVYKDTYHEDLHAFGDMLQEQIYRKMYKGMESHIPKKSRITKAMIDKHYKF